MVSRSNNSGTNPSSEDGGGGGQSWMITFPLAARNAFNLGVDGAALEGVGAAGNLVETQLARAPEIQRVSTSAGSEVYGGFTLGFNNGTTEELVYNATAYEVRTCARYSLIYVRGMVAHIGKISSPWLGASSFRGRSFANCKSYNMTQHMLAGC